MPAISKSPSTLAGGLDRQVDALIRMDPADKDEIFSAGLSLRVECEVDSVVDRCQVIKPRRAIRIADGNEISVAVLLVDRHDARRGEAVNCGQHRRLHQPRIGQCHKVIVAVDQVKLRGVLKDLRDVQVFGYLGIDRRILFIALVHHRVQMGAGDRVGGGEEGHIPSPGHQAFGDVAGHRLPGAILARRRPPGNRRQDSHSLVSSLMRRSLDMAASTSSRATVAKPVA